MSQAFQQLSNISTSDLSKTTVTSEDCVLQIYHTGSGPDLLVLIPGGHGTGSSFYAVLPGLTNSNKYTVATFDRRGHGESRFTPSAAEVNEPMNPAQSARDVLAIIKHLGFPKASVFGTSMGGVIAFQVAIQFPQHVDKLIAHESPTMVLLPGDEGLKYINWTFEVYRIYKTEGPKPAMLRFLSMTKGWKSKASGEGAEIPPPQSEDEVEVDRDHQWWFDNEFMLSIYTPNLLELKWHLDGKYKESMKCVVTVGEKSGDAPYAQSTHVQRDILGCEHQTWPGGHLLYAVDPEGFVKAMLETIKKLEMK